MLEKYIKWLDNLALNVSKKGNILSFIKKHKWKILIFFFLVKGLETMYVLYERGSCVNCTPPTVEQLNDFGGDIEKWNAYNTQFIFMPYTDIKLYMLDLIFPLLLNWGIMVVGLSIIYVIYKIATTLLKKIKTKLSDKLKARYEDILKEQRKK